MSEPVGSAVGLERKHGFDAGRFESAIGEMLAACGFSPDNDHLKNTAQRVRHLWSGQLLDGYDNDPALALGSGFADDRRDMVIVRNIAVRGICPHHLLPFRGVAHVGYLPGGHLHGFGRIARMVDAISHRLTCQEWVTNDIAQALISHGKARGGACWIEAEQLCLLIGEDRRGEERVITQSFRGAFEADAQARSEFLRAVLSGR